jgi:aminomethyltransferase
VRGDFSDTEDLPRVVRSVAVLDRGVARQGAAVFRDSRMIGWVTSGTVVPYWIVEGEGLASALSERSGTHRWRSCSRWRSRSGSAK